MKEKQPHSQSEKRTQARPQRQFRKEPDKQTGFTTGLTRRQLLAGGAAFVGLSALVTLGLVNYQSYFGIRKEKKEEEFSGEIEQTRAYLKKWEEETRLAAERAKGFNEFPEEYFPKIADLATAFFSRQMGYDRKRFEDSIFFLNENEFSTIAYDKSCDDIPSPAVGASTPINEEKIYIRKKRISEAKSPLLTTFSYILHELHHVSAPLEKYNPPIQVTGLDKPVSYKRGLLAAILRDDEKNTSEKECLDLYTYRINLDEAVVQDSTDRLLLLLGIAMSHDYKEWVSLYRDNVLNRFYNGDNKELLSYQQKTQSSFFFQSVGEKLGVKEPHEQIDAGDNFLKNLFNPKP